MFLNLNQTGLVKRRFPGQNLRIERDKAATTNNFERVDEFIELFRDEILDQLEKPDPLDFAFDGVEVPNQVILRNMLDRLLLDSRLVLQIEFYKGLAARQRTILRGQHDLRS